MPTISALLLDLDDTLVGTRDANFRAYRRACRELGRDLSRAVFASHWGQDSRTFLTEIYPGICRDDVAAIRQSKAKHYLDEIDSTVVNEPLRSFAQSLRPSTAIGLVTTAKRANAQPVLDYHALTTLFDVMVFGDDVASGKPSPDCYLLALDSLSIDAASVLAVEDSAHGQAAARAAGVSVLEVKYFA